MHRPTVGGTDGGHRTQTKGEWERESESTLNI
jgi:hypothetical protein